MLSINTSITTGIPLNTVGPLEIIEGIFTHILVFIFQSVDAVV